MPKAPPNHLTSRLILGTVQFGMPYGIANIYGQPSLDIIHDIVQAVFACGIQYLDTASAYGESEKNIGICLQSKPQCSANIITKLPPSVSFTEAQKLDHYVAQSLGKLQSLSLYCVMLHREELLPCLQHEEFASCFAAIKNRGLAQTLGCSVYTPEGALQAIRHPLIDVIQLPSSLLDRRFEKAGVFAEANNHGKIIHIRSALLQGVLCMAPEKIPTHLSTLAPYVGKFHAACQTHSLAPAVVAMQWLLRRYPEAYIIFGAETPEQVLETAKCQQQNVPDPLYAFIENIIPPQSPKLLNPALWRT